MSDDESINSDEIPSDKSSDSQMDEEKEEKALSQLKTSLNLKKEQNPNSKSKNTKEDKIDNNKLYYLENNALDETEKNVQINKSQKIDFLDVFKAFQGDIKNETSRTNLSRAVKNFGITKKDEDINEQNETNNKNKNKDIKKDVNLIKRNYNEKKEEQKLEI